MVLITLLTDFGMRDSYVASLKAKILSFDQSINIIDISHEIDKYHIQQGAFVFDSVYREFPKGTIHLIGLDTGFMSDDYLVVRTENSFFIAPNNGFLSLLTDFNPLQIVKVARKEKTSFHLKNEIVAVACALTQGIVLSELGEEIEEMKTVLLNTPRFVEDELIGSVVFIDSYGNIITNLHKGDIEKYAEGKSIEIKLRREYINQISLDYQTKGGGKCIALYNSEGYLEIAMTDANASKLLGLSYESPVSIKFK